MATNQSAKIQLQADIKEFKKSIDESKKILRGLGDVKVDNTWSKELKQSIEKNIKDARQTVGSEVAKMVGTLNDLAKAGKTNTKEFQDLVGVIGKARKATEELNKEQRRGGGGMVSSGGRMAARVAATAGVTLGVGALLQKQFQVSEQRQGIMALSGGGIDESRSQMGFTPSERRQRQTEVARALGRDLTPTQLREMSDAGEMAQRSHGVDMGTQAQLMGAVRKSGGAGQENLAFTKGMGAAIQAGLTGARVTEFLEGMSGSLESMSEGTVIDSASLRGFAGALSTLPIFKDDPQRSFRAAQTLAQTFQKGDRFQQALASRSIVAAAGGRGTPAEVEVRKNLGLFFGGSAAKETMDNLRKMGPEGEGFAKFLGDTSPDKIIREMFKDIQSRFKDRPLAENAHRFAQETGLDQGEALSLYSKIGATGEISGADIESIKQANMTPQQMNSRLVDTYKGSEKSMADLKSAIETLTETMAGMTGELAAALHSAGKTVGLDAGSTGLAGSVLAGGLGSAAFGMGGSMLGKVFGNKLPGTGGIVGGAKKTGGGLLKKGGGLLKGVGRLVKGAARFLGPAAAVGGAGYAGYEAGSWLNENVLSDDTKDMIGSTLGGLFGVDGPISDEDAMAMAEKNFKGLPAGSKRSDNVLKFPEGGRGGSEESGKKISNGLDDNKGQLSENTSALKELNQILRGRGGRAIGGARPENSSVVGGALGKGNYE